MSNCSRSMAPRGNTRPITCKTVSAPMVGWTGAEDRKVCLTLGLEASGSLSLLHYLEL